MCGVVCLKMCGTWLSEHISMYMYMLFSVCVVHVYLCAHALCVCVCVHVCVCVNTWHVLTVAQKYAL